MLSTYLYLSSFLFITGIYLMAARKNLIMMLIGVEFMFNAANLNLIAFANANNQLDGSVFVLFNLLLAACEASVALAIIIRVYYYYKTLNSNKTNALNG